MAKKSKTLNKVIDELKVENKKRSATAKKQKAVAKDELKTKNIEKTQPTAFKISEASPDSLNVTEAITPIPTAAPVITDVPKSDKTKEKLENKLLKELGKLEDRVADLESKNNTPKKNEPNESESEEDSDEDTEEEDTDSAKVKAYKEADNEGTRTIGESIAHKIVAGGGIGSSIKGAFKGKVAAKVTNVKKAFDPLQIAKNTFGVGGAAIAGKLLGRDQSELEYFTESKKDTEKPKKDSKKTASKVPASEKSGDMTEVLNHIYTFMQKNREDDKVMREENASKKQDEMDLKEKRHKELLAALAKLTGAPIPGGGDANGGDSGGGILGGILGAGSLDALSKAKSFLKGGAKAATGAGEGLAEGAAKSATKVSKLLESSKGILKFLEKIPGLSLIAAGASLIYDVKTAIDRHEAGEIDDNELKKEVIGAVGGGLGGLGGAEVGSILGGAVGSVVPAAGTLVGGILGGAAGFFGGEKLGKYAAEKMFDYFQGGKDVEPPSDPASEANNLKKQDTTKPAAAAPASMPTATPMPASAPAGGAKPSAMPSAAGASATSAAPTNSPNMGTQLSQSIQQNQTMKMDAQVAEAAPTVVNNNSSSSSQQTQQNKGPMPAVRNKESTIERLVYYSTRVV